MNYILLKAECSLHYYKTIIASDTANNVAIPGLPVTETISQTDDENGKQHRSFYAG